MVVNGEKRRVKAVPSSNQITYNAPYSQGKGQFQLVRGSFLDQRLHLGIFGHREQMERARGGVLWR
jgi:hypothetical protein